MMANNGCSSRRLNHDSHHHINRRLVPKGYYTVKAIADYSSLSETRILNLIKSGELPHIQDGRKYLIKVTDFDYWARRKKNERLQVDPMAQKIFDEIMGAA